MVEASLGYYINPLVNVLLGMIVLRERLRPLQWLAVAMATVGVSLQLLMLGEFPWISIVLALSFRSEEHTSELQSLMRISYAVFCLKKKNINSQYKALNLYAN